MSFTLQDVKDFAEELLPGQPSIPGKDILLWGNEFIQDKIGSWGYTEIEDSTTFADMTAEVGVTLPADFVNVVIILDANDLPYRRYYIRNNKLFVKDDGSFTLTYLAYPQRVANLSTAVGLHDALFYPMAYWIAYQFANLDPAKQSLYSKAPSLLAEFNIRFKSVYSKLETDSEAESFQPGPLW